MKKSELQALGLDDKTIRAVQEIHGRDITKLARKAQDPGAAAVREAIKTMLPMVKSIDSLSRILREVLRRMDEKTPRRRDQHRRGPRDPARHQIHTRSALIIPGGRKDCQLLCGKGGVWMTREEAKAYIAPLSEKEKEKLLLLLELLSHKRQGST